MVVVKSLDQLLSDLELYAREDRWDLIEPTKEEIKLLFKQLRAEAFEVWFEDMRRRAWENIRAGYENEPMPEHYLMLLKPYLKEK